MATDFVFRSKAVAQLSTSIGVYVLCDLDAIPLYVGQSRDSIRGRVRRHLTSARSDIIANRQLDLWEVAYVWTYPLTHASEIGPLEALLFHHFNPQSQLINGSVPSAPAKFIDVPIPAQKIQVMTDEEIRARQESPHRLPRQASHYAELVGHFLEVKQSKQIARAMSAHFQRLARYHQDLLGIAAHAESDASDD